MLVRRDAGDRRVRPQFVAFLSHSERKAPTSPISPP
jgi:hypothetical protein